MLAAVVTALIGVSVSMTPYFAGDVAVTRGLQALVPDPSWWALPISRLASAPSKYVVITLALGVAHAVAGWKGSLIGLAAIVLDQYASEASKTLFARPRPLAGLVRVVGTPGGFSFPSGTLTFFSVTFGWVALLGARLGSSVGRAVAAAAAAMMVAGALARVTLGAHWPSDVVLTSVVCLTWLWAVARVALPRARRQA